MIVYASKPMRASIVGCLYLSALSACAFQPGGGGSTQTVPDSVQAGQPAILSLELSVWGSGGAIEGRYTDVVASYHLVGEAEYRKLAPKLVAHDERHETYAFTIPAYPTGTAGEIEYYFDLKLDHQPSRIGGIKKIRVTP